MLTERELRVRFQELNKKYFGGRLPAYSIRVVNRMSWRDESGWCGRNRRRIKIKSGQSNEDAVSTLLHEMAHAATGDSHGRRWQKEMRRLAVAGAPIDKKDLETKDGRVTKDYFRAVVGDLLLDDPTISLEKAIRHFIYYHGGEAATVKEFLRRHPSAPDVFGSARKEAEKITSSFAGEGLRTTGP